MDMDLDIDITEYQFESKNPNPVPTLELSLYERVLLYKKTKHCTKNGFLDSNGLG